MTHLPPSHRASRPPPVARDPRRRAHVSVCPTAKPLQCRALRGTAAPINVGAGRWA